MKEQVQSWLLADDDGCDVIRVFYAGDLAARCSTHHLHRSLNQDIVMDYSLLLTILALIVFVK